MAQLYFKGDASPFNPRCVVIMKYYSLNVSTIKQECVNNKAWMCQQLSLNMSTIKPECVNN